MANIGKLMRGAVWARREFAEGSIPNTKTLRRWVEDGTVRGRIVSGKVYIFDTEKFGVTHHVSAIVDQLMRQ